MPGLQASRSSHTRSSEFAYTPLARTEACLARLVRHELVLMRKLVRIDHDSITNEVIPMDFILNHVLLFLPPFLVFVVLSLLTFFASSEIRS